MRKLLSLLWGILACILISMLTGCRSAKEVERFETKIVHDSVYLHRDSIVYRFVKDSVSQSEKTTILTKHDTITGRDTVFSTKVLEKTKYTILRDTINTIVYNYIEKKAEDKKEVTKEQQKSLGSQIWDKAQWPFFILLVLGAFILYFRFKR